MPVRAYAAGESRWTFRVDELLDGISDDLIAYSQTYRPARSRKNVVQFKPLSFSAFAASMMPWRS
jgi:hypothetical protein